MQATWMEFQRSNTFAWRIHLHSSCAFNISHDIINSHYAPLASCLNKNLLLLHQVNRPFIRFFEPLDIYISTPQELFTMKASAISLLVFLFASLGSSLSIRGPPPGRAQDDKDLAAGKPKWPSETPPPVDDVTFSWCHSYNNTESCFSRDLKHGWCCESVLHRLGRMKR